VEFQRFRIAARGINQFLLSYERRAFNGGAILKGFFFFLILWSNEK